MKSKNVKGAIIIEGHIQGLANTRAFGEYNIPVIVVDTQNCISRYSKYCSAFYKCPKFDSYQFIEFLIKLSQKHDLSDWVLIPSNDHAVKNISVNKELLQNHYKIITDDYKIISKIYDKRKLLELSEQIGVPIPKTYFPNNNELREFELNFPVIIKGIEGLTFYKTLGKKAYLAKDEKELEILLQSISEKLSLKKVFIQEVIDKNKNNFVCSFTSFSIRGKIKTHWSGEKIREHPIKFGTATFTKSVETNETLEYGTKLIEELNYTGVCEIEFLKDPNDNLYKLIEINARTWLWVELAKISGIEYVKYIYNHLNGILTEYPTTFRKDLYWINLVTDSVYSIIAIIKGEFSINDYFKTLKNSIHWAVFSKNDIFPFVMFILLLPYLAFKR